jgi:hypothetical protein
MPKPSKPKRPLPRAPQERGAPRPLPEVFHLLVECQSEAQQRELYELLARRGVKCRVITL